MADTGDMQEDAPVEAEASAGQRWPVGVALVTAWLFPATTARRTAHARLFHIWLAHVAALLLTTLAALFCVAWSDTTSFKWRQLVWAIEDLLDEFILEASRDPLWAILRIVGGFLLIEISHVGLALLFMPWGAKDEPLQVSFRSSLRRTWIQSTHLLFGVLAVGSVAVLLGHLEANWETKNPRSIVWPVYPTPPNLAPDDPGYDQAIKQHEAAAAEYTRKAHAANRAYQEWQRRKPWYILEPSLPSALLGFGTGLWVMWALLRSIGAPRRTPLITRPPLCTHCGYNLHTISIDSRCPECGEAVRESLGSDAQPGAPWMARRATGRLTAWRRTVVEAILHPKTFGRRLRQAGADTDHRSLFACHLPAIFLVGAVGVLGTFFIVLALPGLPTRHIGLLPILFLPASFGCACVVGTIVVAHAAALLVGLAQSWRFERNLLPASMQMAAYLSGYLVAWAILGAVHAGILLTLAESGWLRQLRDVTGLVASGQFILLFAVPNLAWGVVYLILVARGTAAARYANK